MSTSINLFTQDLDPRWLLGGTIGFDRSANTSIYISDLEIESSDQQFIFSPYLAKTINDRWIAGITSNFTFRQNLQDLIEDNRVQKTQIHEASFGLFSRAAITSTGKSIVLYFEPSVLFNFGNTIIRERGSEVSRVTRTSYAMAVDPVMTYRLSPSVNLIGRFSGLGYEIGTWKTAGNSSKMGFSRFSGTFDLTSVKIGLELML